MKKLLIPFLTFSLLLSACQADIHHDEDGRGHENEQENQELSQVDSDGPLQIMASFYPLAHFTAKVGGDRVQVTNMTPVGGEPHDFEPSPRELAELQAADLFVYMGASFEPWAEDAQKSIALKNTLEISQKLELMKHEEEKEDHDEHEDDEHEENHDEHEDEHEDDEHEENHDEHEDEHEDEEDHEDHDEHNHGEFDPHIWLDPVLAQEQITIIMDTLSKIDPEHSDIYQQNAAEYLQSLESLDQDFTAAFSSCALSEVIVSHDAFAYLGARYDIDFHSISGISPQSEPSAKHMAELTDLAQDKGIQHVFFETLVSDKLATTIAAEANAEILVLNPIEGLTPDQADAGVDYLSLMRENLTNLKIALQCQ